MKTATYSAVFVPKCGQADMPSSATEKTFCTHLKMELCRRNFSGQARVDSINMQTISQ